MTLNMTRHPLADIFGVLLPISGLDEYNYAGLDDANFDRKYLSMAWRSMFLLRTCSLLPNAKNYHQDPNSVLKQAYAYSIFSASLLGSPPNRKYLSQTLAEHLAGFTYDRERELFPLPKYDRKELERIEMLADTMREIGLQ